jgi:hypothetical protein
MFAAKQLPLALAAAAPQVGAAAFYFLLLLAAAFFCGALLRDAAWRDAQRNLDPPGKIFLVIGCALVAGCFFAGQSIDYRGIFFLFALPGLLGLSRAEPANGAAALARWTGPLVVALMWKSFLRVALEAILHRSVPAAAGRVVLGAFWGCKEVLWWWCVAVMLAVLLAFLIESPAWRGLLASLRRPAPAPG